MGQGAISQVPALGPGQHLRDSWVLSPSTVHRRVSVSFFGHVCLTSPLPSLPLTPDHHFPPTLLSAHTAPHLPPQEGL